MNLKTHPETHRNPSQPERTIDKTDDLERKFRARAQVDCRGTICQHGVPKHVIPTNTNIETNRKQGPQCNTACTTSRILINTIHVVTELSLPSRWHHPSFTLYTPLHTLPPQYSQYMYIYIHTSIYRRPHGPRYQPHLFIPVHNDYRSVIVILIVLADRWMAVYNSTMPFHYNQGHFHIFMDRQ